MIELIHNEWMKIFKRPGSLVMITILVLTVVIFSAVVKSEYSGTNTAVDKNWKQNLTQENTALKGQLDNKGSGIDRQSLRKKMLINKYRLAHNIPPETNYHIWDFVNNASQLILLTGLFTIIISAGIVSSEFQWGTAKLLLIRPISRTKILLSKYLTVLLFALFMLTILFVLSTIIGAILFGLPDHTSIYIGYFNGKVAEQNMVVHLLLYYGMSSINMLMLATMAFMISSVFRNTSLAIGLSLTLMFTGSTLTQLLGMRFSWAKYILFANTDLTQYFDGTPIVTGTTLSFSILMLMIYFFVFQILSFYVFNKRDIAA